MASSDQQVTTGSVLTSQEVGNAVAQQYYRLLRKSPELVCRFYQDVSKLGRPEDNGIMSSVSTLEAINAKILSLDYGEFSAEIRTVDVQDSHDGAVLVLVTGNLTGKDNVKRNFTQTFFLAPQDKGFFVLNDMFRFVDDANHDKDQYLAGEVDATLTPEQVVVQENHMPEQMTTSSEEANGEEVYNPSENGNLLAAEEDPPVAEVIDEIQDDSQFVAESNSKIDDMPKKSYASIVKVTKESGTLLSATTTTPTKSALNKQQVTASPPPVALPAETSVVNSIAVENGNMPEAEANGYSIYIRNLPMNATPALLEAEFKRFGPIRSNGIQVRSNRGFCFGFVEFEVATAVQSSIEAAPILIGGYQAYVEVKRSQGNNRGRITNGQRGGGFRSDGVRGRGSYGGGRGYNRVDFINRTEFGNRNGGWGGYPNRGGDRFQRVDFVASNSGGRENRAGGMTVNSTTKSMA